MTRHLIAVGVCGLLLFTTSCNGEPEPAPPTAVLPTPPTPSASPTADEQAAVLGAFSRGQKVVEDLYSGRGSDQTQEALEPYFTGKSLEFYVADLKHTRENNIRVEGKRRIDASVVALSGSSATREATIRACSDYTQSRTVNEDGSEFDRGFDYSIDTVEMVLDPGSQTWRSADFNSEPVSDFEGTECSGG